jgi:uncharacterized protein
MNVLVDTGPIVAILSSSDEHHEACVQQLQMLKGTLLTCWPVLTEVAWLLRAHPLAINAFFTSFGSGPFRLAALEEGDLPGITAIMRRYRDLKIQLADAALLHLANREGVETVFTLDRRDFGVLRLARNRRLRVIP